MVSRDVWGKHPDELEGRPFQRYMLLEMTALALIEDEERQARRPPG